MASKSKSIVGWAAAGAVLVVLSGSATDSLAAKKRPAHHAQHHKAVAPTANELETQAMAFESFMRHGREIDADFKSSSQVSRGLQTGAGHDAEKLEADMIAYAAMAALQEPSFVEGLRAAQAQNSDLVARISADPDAVLRLPGAGAAAGRASAALVRQGEDLAKTGARVQSASYSVQHAAWSKARIANPRSRLDVVKRVSAAAYRPEAGEAAKLQTALASGGREGGASPVVTRGVALAALSVLGAGDRGASLTKEPSSGMCLNMAKLNYYQCLASAGTEFEDIYCLGKHALVDTGECVSKAAEAPQGQMSAIPASYRR